MSVLDVNPSHDPDINGGLRYVGHYGHHACGGIAIARTDDLDAGSLGHLRRPGRLHRRHAVPLGVHHGR